MRIDPTHCRLLCLPLLASLLSSAWLQAHGGQYRGPASVTPPSSGSASSGTGTAGSTGSSRTSGDVSGGGSTSGANKAPPAAPGPTAPAAGKGNTARGVSLDDDLTRWQYWWEFGKDPFLRLKDALQGVQPGSDDALLGALPGFAARDVLRPTADDRENRIVPVLVQTLSQIDNRDVVSGCMVALAKVGIEPKGIRLGTLFARQLQSHDQEIRETAALCLGIAGLPDPANIRLLLDLAGDTAAGRAACGRAEVDERTRSFAVYGLGLLGHRLVDLTLQKQIHGLLAGLLAPEQPARRNLQVAAIEALSLLRAPDDHDGLVFHAEVLQTLADYFLRDLGPGAQLVQAHCPTAIARLCPRGSPHAARFKAMFREQLLAGASRGRSNVHLAQSCVLALGQLALPVDDAAAEDAGIAALLLRTWREDRDRQTRNFAILALGEIGGEHVRGLLLQELDKAGRALELPWVAMALGVSANRRYEAARAERRHFDPDRVVGERLLASLEDVKNPDTQAALAIALGMCRHRAAGDKLRQLLLQDEAGDELGGYLSIGLALMDDRRAVPDIRAVTARFLRRPALLRQSATALGRLGDKQVATDLALQLREGGSNLTQISAIAGALGQIGDRRSIEPLIAVLQDQGLPMLSRAFAAMALGGIGDKDPLPWNAALAAGWNYRAAVETLTDGACGVLDIL